MDDLEKFSKEVLSTAIKTIKQSSTLPTAEDDFEYYSNFVGYRTFCSRVGARINKLIGKVIQYESVPVSWPTLDKTVMAPSELIEEHFDSLVETNDILLERIGELLDKVSGIKQSTNDTPTLMEEGGKDTAVNVASWNKKDKKLQSTDNQHQLLKMLKSNVPRPQGLFKDMVDNSESPFIPLLRTKPNALKPLPEVYSQLKAPSTLQALIENAKKWAESPNRLSHPYQYEIEQFEPSGEQLVIREPVLHKSLEETELVMITTPDQLVTLLTELKDTTELAIDLEAHSYRSFQGFVCLMQLSTRTKDYIVDTLLLREHLYCLNEVFTDPNIIKVMHGADWDICWLQRDFGLYVVNLFDTGQASRVLGLPRYSLAYLLDYCCGVTADKQYQLADWRIRPLPSNMLKYAREDTHYLLYVYDRMRNELLRRSNAQGNLLKVVVENSREICLKQYIKPILRDDDYLKLCRKFKRSLSPPQLYCLKLLYEWRYNLARREDESCGYVLPNHMLFQLAEILPRELEGIQACCNPVPTLLRQQLQEVHRLIQTAREYKPTAATLTATSTNVLVTSTHISSDRDKSTEVDEKKREGTNQEENMEEGEEGVDYSIITGPPVTTGVPIISFNVLKPVKLPQVVQDRYSRLQEMFVHSLAQFMVPSAEGGPQLTAPTTFKSRREEHTPFHQLTVAKKRQSPSKQEKEEESRQKEEESGEEEEESVSESIEDESIKSKTPRLEQEEEKEERTNFEAFDYSATTFSSAVPEPKSSNKPPKKLFGHTHKEKGPPRSKVSRKSSHKSDTFKTRK